MPCLMRINTLILIRHAQGLRLYTCFVSRLVDPDQVG
jgi:hypothetical protein